MRCQNPLLIEYKINSTNDLITPSVLRQFHNIDFDIAFTFLGGYPISQTKVPAEGHLPRMCAYTVTEYTHDALGQGVGRLRAHDIVCLNQLQSR